MPNLRLISSNAANSATLSASSSASASLGVTNLTTQYMSQKWRSTGLQEYVAATWSTLKSVRAAVLLRTDLTTSATMRLRLTSEAQATNELAYSNDFTQAVWNKANLAALTTGVAGPDGTNSATTLTANAANGEIYQTVNLAGNSTSSIWIRRRTGTGSISLRNTANTAWIALSVTSTWKRFTNDGGTNATTGALDLLIATSGDSIDIAFGQLEPGTTASSYYPTAGAAATRPLGYIDSWQTYTYDSGAKTALPAPGDTAVLWAPAAVNAYGARIDIADTTNPAGYLEVGRLVLGNCWEYSKNIDYGAAVAVDDTSANVRNSAGDLLTDPGTLRRKLTFSQSKLDAQGAGDLWDILWANGRATPVFISVFPESSDGRQEQRYQMLAKLSNSPALSLPNFSQYAVSLEYQEV